MAAFLLIKHLRLKIDTLKRDLHALYLAARDPRTPWYAKAFATCVVAYALSPIDLIPDPIPIVGYLDDLVLLPLGIYLSLKLVPQSVIADCRRKAALAPAASKRIGLIAAALIILLWMIAGSGMCIYLWRIWSR